MNGPNSFGVRFTEWRQRAVRLVFDRDFSELASWSGVARLVGLWFLLTLGCVLTPFYVLIRMLFLRGGVRFVLALLASLFVIAFVALLFVFAAGMAGLGSIR